jgi:hypothetical protein
VCSCSAIDPATGAEGPGFFQNPTEILTFR